MHNKPETLGDIIKIARENSEYTIEELAEKVGISERYLYKIENEGRKPSYDVLYKLIRVLAIPSDSIFYPEKTMKDIEIEYFIRKLYSCDTHTITVLKATVRELISLFINN